MRLPFIKAPLFSFKSLYVAFVAAVLFYGQVRVMFGLTPRHIAIAAMLIACLRSGVPYPNGRIIKAYIVFVFTFLVSALVTGYVRDVLIVYYIAAYIGIWATKILIEKYRSGSLLLYTIVVLGVINAVVTIGQALGLTLADRIISFFQLSLPDKYVIQMEEDGSDDLVLMLTRPGMFISAVYNGYFLMTSGVVSLLLVARDSRLLRVVPWFVISLGCICVQERGPIFILTVFSALIFYRTLVLKRFALGLLLSLFVLSIHFVTNTIASVLPQRIETISVYTPSGMTDEDDESSDVMQNNSSSLRKNRLADLGFDDTGRGRIYGQVTDYLMDHPFVGGYHRLKRIYGHAPHNLFLNAFIYGGIIGGFAIMLILIWQAPPLWRVLRRKIHKTDTICFFAGLAYVAFTLNSLVHNKSIVTGDEMVWMLWALFYYEYRKYYNSPSL